jgi:hypothetical protein
MAERGDPARNHMPSGLLAIDIQGHGGRAGYSPGKWASIGFIAYSYHSQLDSSVLEPRDVDDGVESQF